MHQIQKGMTLIELMVSIAIMAVIAAGAFQVYSNLQSAHDRVVEKTTALNNLQRVWHLMQQDFRFALSRQIRPADDTFGGEDQELFTPSPAPFAGQTGLIQLSRNSGLPNLISLRPQSELRRIAYGLDGENLYRYQWSHMDPAPDERPLEMLLLEGVESLEFRFGYQQLPEQGADPANQQDPGQGALNQQQTVQPWLWVAQWPEAETPFAMEALSGEAAESSLPELPAVVEVTLTSSVYGTLQRVFAVGAPDAGTYASLLDQASQIQVNDQNQNQNQSEDLNQNDNLNQNQDQNQTQNIENADQSTIDSQLPEGE